MKFTEALKAWNGGIERGAQTRLAKALKLNQSTISQWANGNLSPGEELRQKLAKVFGVTLEKINAMFAADKGDAMMVRDNGGDPDWISIPIMGRAPAGTPTEAFENFLGYHPAPAKLIRGDRSLYFFIEIVGMSMIGLQIGDGDKVLIHRQEEANDGDVVIAEIEGDGITCKRFRIKNGKPTLEAANPSMAPMKNKAFRVVGKKMWRAG